MRAPALRLMLPRHASPRRFRTRARGIGLLGVVLTLGCVALLAGLIIPAFFGRHTVTLDNAALLLARDLRAVQNRAAHTGQKTQLRFEEHGWRALDENGRPLLRIVGEESIERRLDSDGVFEGVTLESIQFGPESTVEFQSSGKPDRGGSLEVVFRGRRRQVVLEPAHGRVSIEGLARPWKDEGF
jgi:hypothetical protein